MAPTESWASSEAVRRSMQANRSRDTTPELTVRRLLHARGLRYRVAYKPPGTHRVTVDIAFPGPRVIVLIDGCFWHGCPDHYREPKTNTDYWRGKIAKNQARDADVTQTLTQAGWTVLRFWEHDPPDATAAAVEAAVRAPRKGGPKATPSRPTTQPEP